MEQSKKRFNRRTGALILKNSIVLLVLILVCALASFSWFTKGTRAFADGINVKSEAPHGLEIAIVEHGADPPDSGAYNKGTILLNKKNCAFIEKLQFTEITGSGEQDEFYKPFLTQANGVATPDLTADWDKAQENIHFLSFDLYMRSKSPFKVNLDATSSVRPVAQKLIWTDPADAEGNNPSTGNFSRDCIVGATRVSILDKNAALKYLWIPAANIQYNHADKSVVTNLTNTNGSTYKHKYYEVTSSAKTLVTAPSVITNNKTASFYTLGTVKQLVSVETKANSDTYYVDYVTVNLWIDGEDDEARLALTGGNFVLGLDLSLV